MWPDPSRIDLSLDARSVTFENPAGARGAGGTAHGGRKGAPSLGLLPGTRATLADLTGPGTIRHFWCTVPPAPPEAMRALVLEVFYDGNDEPSISVPLLDFFGAALGRPVAYSSLLTVIAEGRGFNAYFPMPFRKHVRIELHNHSTRYVECYYQIDYTLEPSIAERRGRARTQPFAARTRRNFGATSSSPTVSAAPDASSAASSGSASSIRDVGTARAK